MRKPHDILGVKEHPKFSEVRKAYKELSLKYHPDRHPGEEDKYHVLMSEINAAYDYFKKILPHDDEGNHNTNNTTSKTKTVYEEEPRKKWGDYTQEEKQRIWEEMRERWRWRSQEAYKESGRKMRNKIAKNLEPIRDVNKKFKSDIQECKTYIELKNLANSYSDRIEEMIIAMYEYTENSHRYGMPPNSFYHSEIFEENVNKNFPLVKVNSSQIDSVGYDKSNQYLYVRFRGGALYVYYGVVEYIFDGFMKAQSMGKYFGAYIRNKYKYTRLTQ